MNFLKTILLVAFLFPAAVFSQISWQTASYTMTGQQCQLSSNIITVTVHPFHLDVEEEATITAVYNDTWNSWDGDQNALEITGDFVLTKGSSVRSMLLWEGTKILKAKLKDRSLADSAYEATVDRTRPQFPHDPALIEYLGNSSYRFKIYPVAVNNSRRIRILYSVPFLMFRDGPQFQLLTAFTGGTIQAPSQIPVNFKLGTGNTGNYIFSYGNIKKTIQFNATYQIPTSSFLTPTYDYNYYYGTYSYLTGYSMQPLVISPDTNFSTMAFTAAIGTGKSAGKYTAVFATPPDTVAAALSELPADQPASVEAKIVIGENAYITDFNEKGFLGVYMKSTALWDSTVMWNVYDSKGKIAFQCRKAYKPKSDSLINAMLPLVWGAKYTLAEGNDNLGALYGFVDRRMSLLALEKDSLSTAQALQWAKSGVPPLLPREIMLTASQMPSSPDEDVIFEIGTGVKAAYKNLAASFTVLFRASHLISLRFNQLKTGQIKVALFDMHGRTIETWNNVQITGGSAELQLPRKALGCMVLRVTAGNQVVQKRINIVR
jgi:hypothetical protein